MTKQEISHLLKRPHAIAEEQLFSLQYLLQRYPYFQSIRMLIAKTKYRLRSPDARNFLSKTTLYATDLKKLKAFVRGVDVAVRPPGNYHPSPSVHAESSTQKSAETLKTMDSAVDYVEKTLSADERAYLVAEVMQGVFSLKEKMSAYEANEMLREERETKAQQAYAEAKRRKEEEKSAEEERIAVQKKAEQEETESMRNIANDLQTQKAITQKQQKEAEQRQEELKKWKEEAQKWKEEAQHQEKKTYINEQIRLQSAPHAAHPMAPPPSSSSSTEPPVQAGAPVQVIFGQSPQPSAIPSPGNPFLTQSFPIPHLPLQNYPVGYTSPMPYTSYTSFSAPQPTPLSVPMYLQPAPPSSSTFTPYTSPATPPSSTAYSSPQEAPNRAKQDEIIERFIKKTSIDESADTSINDEICSEELAQLYEDQGYKERAIEIYRRLCYKYPEKKQIFVAKISKLKK